MQHRRHAESLHAVNCAKRLHAASAALLAMFLASCAPDARGARKDAALDATSGTDGRIATGDPGRDAADLACS